MDIIIYIFIFAIGVVLGSFYTLAVYRIPLKQDITHTRSYCPKCNHKLNFWDLIPILSYVFLRGRCRYCKKKIRPRYIIIETLSGVIFLIFTIALNIDFLNPEPEKLGTLVFGAMFLSTIFIVIGIFKEYKKIWASVMNFGIISQIVYIVYLYILNKNIYRYIIYIPVILLITFVINSKKTNEICKTCMVILFIIMSFFEISTVALI